MSFIGNETGKAYAPGWFLAHEECERKTYEIPQTGATTADNGGKYVKMGAVYPANGSSAIGIVYEEQRDEKGMLVQKPLPEGVTTDELRLQNAPLGIIYLSDYAWNNVVNIEPRAKLRLERLKSYVAPYMPANTKPCPNLQFTLEELNTLANYETNFNDYVRANLIKWLLGGGVTDTDWASFQSELSSKVNIEAVKRVYQDAYDRYLGN